MGKTTLLEDIVDCWLTSGGVALRAAASESAQRVSLAALAGLLGRNTATVGTAIDDLRSRSGLLVVDDADLLDDDSAVVMHTLGRERAVLAAVRLQRPHTADAISRFVAERTTHVLTLEPLSRGDTTSIIEADVGGPIDRASGGELHHASEGNPLLLRELIVANKRTGTLSNERGVWILRGLVAGSSVREIFSDQVRTWSSAVRTVVAATAIAQEVPSALLAACFGEGSVNEARTLGGLVISGSGVATPRHALLRDAVLAEVDNATRIDLLRTLLKRIDSSSADSSARVSDLRHGLWLLALGEHERLDVDIVLKAAHRALDTLQMPLARALAKLAFRHDPGQAALELLVRLGLATVPDEAPMNEALRFESLTGRFESFVFGFSGHEGLVDAFQTAQIDETHNGRRLHYEVYARAIEWVGGQHVDLALASLERLADADIDSGATIVAALFASNAALLAGRLQRGLAIVETASKKTAADNAFYQAQLGLTAAEGLLRLGQTSEAIARSQAIAALDSETNLGARFYKLAFDAQLQMQQGQIHDAKRTLGTMIAMLNQLDPVGVGSWANAWLAATLAWTTSPGVVHHMESPLTPQNGRFLEPELQLAYATRLAESGRLMEARAAALATADQAAGAGHHGIAYLAALLAMRLQPTQSVADLVIAQAARIDGDVAPVIANYARMLVSQDPQGLEKAAARFLELDHQSLAHEAFVRASAAHRSHGQRSGASRCASEALHLEDAGLTPNFAARSQPSVVGELTLREREVALAVAEGQTHRTVADALGMSQRTAETHLHRAYRKLGVNNPTDLRTVLGHR